MFNLLRKILKTPGVTHAFLSNGRCYFNLAGDESGVQHVCSTYEQFRDQYRAHFG